jgi:hyperosmotically inducible protein
MQARAAMLVLWCTLAALSGACTSSDDDIRRDVDARVTTAPETKDLTLSVQVQDGMVRLSGRTATHDEQKAAMRLVRSIEGVKVVVNEMWVGNPVLIERVREALAADGLVGGIPIEVDARGDVVRLISDQTNEQQRTRAVQIASAVPGVRQVDDLMK